MENFEASGAKQTLLQLKAKQSRAVPWDMSKIMEIDPISSTCEQLLFASRHQDTSSICDSHYINVIIHCGKRYPTFRERHTTHGASHVARHTFHAKHHTSPVTRHSSHFTPPHHHHATSPSVVGGFCPSVKRPLNPPTTEGEAAQKPPHSRGGAPSQNPPTIEGDAWKLA